MCGSATLAIEVSSTSINVASVTVSAITQGLIVPSGILSLARILLRIALGSPSSSLSTYDRSAPYRYSRSIRNHCRVDIHPRPQYGLLLWDRIENDLHGN